MFQQKNKQPAADVVSDSRKRLIYLSVLGELILTLHVLIAHTRKMLALRRFRQVYSCMEVVNRIYESGNEPQKIAVANLYINELTSLQSVCTRAEWSLVQKMMPASIYRVYLEQSGSRSHHNS